MINCSKTTLVRFPEIISCSPLLPSLSSRSPLLPFPSGRSPLMDPLDFQYFVCHNERMMTHRSSLSFKVYCPNCYGREIWKIERIFRALTKPLIKGVPADLSLSDEEKIAELFITRRTLIRCPGCGKTGVLTVERIPPTEEP